MATPTATRSSRCAAAAGRPLASSQPTQNTASTQNSRASATVSQDGQISWCSVARCARRACAALQPAARPPDGQRRSDYHPGDIAGQRHGAVDRQPGVVGAGRDAEQHHGPGDHAAEHVAQVQERGRVHRTGGHGEHPRETSFPKDQRAGRSFSPRRPVPDAPQPAEANLQSRRSRVSLRRGFRAQRSASSRARESCSFHAARRVRRGLPRLVAAIEETAATQYAGHDRGLLPPFDPRIRVLRSRPTPA